MMTFSVVLEVLSGLCDSVSGFLGRKWESENWKISTADIFGVCSHVPDGRAFISTIEFLVSDRLATSLLLGRRYCWLHQLDTITPVAVCKDSYVILACGFNQHGKWSGFCESCNIMTWRYDVMSYSPYDVTQTWRQVFSDNIILWKTV